MNYLNGRIKNSLLILVMISLLITFLNSCSDNSINNNNETPKAFTISGKIENWYHGTNKQLILSTANNPFGPTEYLDTTIITSNGNFSLNFDLPKENTFITFEPFFPECTSNVFINPEGVKWLILMLTVNSGTQALGTLNRATDTINVDDSSINSFFVFFNKTGNVFGQDSCYTNGSSITFKYELYYNENKLTEIKRFLHVFSGQHTEYYYKTDYYPDLKWYFFN